MDKKEDNQTNELDLNHDGKVDIKEAVQYFVYSKTIWVNIIALFAFFVQNKYGFIIDESTQLEILSMVNVFLRTITHKPISFSK